MIPHATGLQLARHVERLLAPACVEIMVVGSVRRGAVSVKDIEILARPKRARPTFGVAESAESPLAELLARLRRDREIVIRPNPAERKDGPRYKTLWLPMAGGVPIDLFIADHAGLNWGNLAVIRTGPHDFSRLLVTAWDEGGLMPPGLVHRGGYLRDDAGDIRPCRTEEEFFRQLGIAEVPDPSARNQAMAERLRGRLAAGRVTA